MGANSTALNRPNRALSPVQRLRPIPESDGADRRRSVFARAFEQDVLPRLVQQHARGRGPAAPHHAAISESQVSHLAELALQPTSPAAVAFVLTFLDEGFAAETLYLDLLAPAAALLGEAWANDACSFADVTIGLVRLQQGMRALAPSFFGPEAPARSAARRALLLPFPGEQHTFGLAMLADFFRRDGWSAWHGIVPDMAGLQAMVAGEWVDMVGLSMSSEDILRSAAGAIARLRAASRNPDMVVMVGGGLFARDPARAEAMGADGTAVDGKQAVAAANALLPAAMRRS